MKDEEIIGRCFEHMKAQFSTTKPRGVLLNGSIELFLKAVFANGIDQIDGWSYVMDKQFDTGRAKPISQQVDLLILEGKHPKIAIPKIAIEFKSTLRGDRKKVRSDARRALQQARQNHELSVHNDAIFGGCTSYIVHFLTDPYPVNELPEFICAKFEVGRGRSMTAEKLCTFYSAESNEVECECVSVITGGDGLQGVVVDAVLVKINRAA